MVLTRASLRLPLLFVAALLSALALCPAAAVTNYVIYTKDGTRLEAREKPTVSGRRLLFLNNLGSPQSIAIEEWDKERTEKANEAGLGGAYVLDTPDQKTIQPPAAKTPSLSEYIKAHKKNELDTTGGKGRGVDSAGEPAAAGKASKAAPAAEAAAALDPQTNDVFTRAFDQASLRGARLSPVPQGVRVQVITETEQQIFWALGAVARGLKESRAYGRSVDKVDLWMVTSSGDPAGHFTMSPEDAEALLNNRITPAKYFVANVIFQ
jgi:hypothetical protein